MQYEYVRKTFTFNGRRYSVRGKTEKEAMQKMIALQVKLEKEEVVVCSSMLVREWAYKCVEIYKTNQKEITREKYMQRMNACILKQRIGSMKLKDVRSIDVQEVMNLQIGKSKTQINEVYQQLQFIFSKAVDNRLLNSNPAKAITKPKGYKNTRRCITDYERQILIKAAEVDQRYNLFILMLYTGLRPSEAMNVMAEDIIIENGRHLLHVRGTKTEKSDRYIPLLPQAIPIVTSKKKGYIFTSLDGRKLNETSYKRLTQSLYRTMNILMGCKMYRNQLVPPYPLADDFQPYCLRHTFATDLAKAGVDIRVTQKLLGHSTLQMLSQVYTHLENDSLIDAIDKLA